MNKTMKQTAQTVTAAPTVGPHDRLYMFLVWGTALAPKRVVVNALRKSQFDEGCRIAETRARDSERARARVYADIFGKGVEVAVLCHRASMAQLATEYPNDAPHAQAVKYLAACVALGRVPGEGQSGEPGGGQEASIEPVKPRPRKPSGGAKVVRQPELVSA